MPSEAFLVSGGSGGIGCALCRVLAEAGHRPVVGFARSEESAREVAKETGGFALPLDLSEPTSIDAAVARLTAETPSLMGVVLAGSPPPRLGPFAQITPAQMLSQWTVNVAGPQHLLAGLIRQIFRKSRRGIVLGVLTEAVGDATHPPMAGMGAYTVAKAGAAGMFRLLAADYAWLHVDTVSPGFVETGMLRAFDERFLEILREQTGPFRQPDDVAREIFGKIEQGLRRFQT